MLLTRAVRQKSPAVHCFPVNSFVNMRQYSSVKLAQVAWDLARYAEIDFPEDWNEKSRGIFRFAIGSRFALLADLTSSAVDVAYSYRRAILSTRLSAMSYCRAIKELVDWIYAFMACDPNRSLVDELSQLFKQADWRCATKKIVARSLVAVIQRITDPVMQLTAAIQLITYDYKMTIDSSSITEQALDDYIQSEESMQQWRYSSGWLPRMADVWADWLQTYDRKNCIPKNGPGSTFETVRGSSIAEKYEAMVFPSELARIITDTWSVPLPHSHVCPDVLNRTSKLICVPKTAVKKRTISAEPAALQWAQQGVRSALVKCINASSTCRVYLEDQTKSRDLALRGSLAGEWDTIDLSAASDSVTVSLVEILTSKTSPDVYEDLMSTRSEYTQLEDGRIVHLCKFAPMGSATCFPVESLVFASICEAVIREKTGRTSRNMDYLVYGDDIVIRSCYYHDVKVALEECHFTLNSRKTFHSSYDTWLRPIVFREACGIEAINGLDVTPLRISRRLQALKDGTISPVPASIAAWCDLHNRAHQAGFRLLRAMVSCGLKTVLGADTFSSIKRESTPYSSAGIYLLTDEQFCTNFACATRWNHRLQRKEHRCLTLKTVKSTRPGTEYYALYEAYLAMQRRSTTASADPLPSVYERHREDVQVFRKGWR